MPQLPQITVAWLLAIAAWASTGVYGYAEDITASHASFRNSAETGELPNLGLESQLIAGYGEQVTFVQRGSKAFRLGLKEQDVILSLNGKRLTFRGAWQTALQAAMENGGVATLKVRDARTGTMAIRRTNILNY